MTNQEAINYLLNPLSLPESVDIKDKLRWHEDALNMAIEALKAQEVPSVQPEKRTEERTETHACDLISRQAVIDLWEKYHPYIAIKACEYDAKLRRLLSVQPEQKTCEGCKHSGQWEDELEYGASCSCLVCKRRASDNYERSD